MQPDLPIATTEPAALPAAPPASDSTLEVVLAYLRAELAHIPTADRDELLALATELFHETEPAEGSP